LDLALLYLHEEKFKRQSNGTFQYFLDDKPSLQLTAKLEKKSSRSIPSHSDDVGETALMPLLTAT